jgi:predicted aconitase
MQLTDFDKQLIEGEHGQAAVFAMDVLLSFAEAVRAPRLLDITRAHIDGCLYHGQASLDFVNRLVEHGGRVRVPTTLNVGAMDLLHPALVRTAGPEREAARQLMQAHLKLGCEPSFTCAPYQTRFRPHFGEQIAWGESNAIVFANSVIGARTNRYGDFIDLCCAMTGRAPAVGLHLDEGRRGQVLFRLRGFPESQASDAIFVGVGYLVGERSGLRVPVIDGLPHPHSEDQLKALGAVAASTGSVALFHAVGITPESATLKDAFGPNGVPEETIDVYPEDVEGALCRLSTVPDGTPISAVSLGTPHFSIEEFRSLAPLLAGFTPAPGVHVYVNTNRETYAALEAGEILPHIQRTGIVVVTDTCTYVTAIIRPDKGAIMTNSGKWAHYAPANLGVGVAFGALEDCLLSAAAGRVVRTVK